LARGGIWRAIAKLRASPQAVLNTLVSLRGAAELRVVSASGASAAARVPSRRSSL
jgi:hypothetical protein